MATPNYSYEKRQRELAKKKKKEEKAKKKTSDHGPGDSQGNDGGSGQDAPKPV
nr:hypothetical protein [uncultured Roseateles sp.]